MGTPKGSLYLDDSAKKKKEDPKDYGKGRRTEDEEWELQIRKELEKKKAAASANNETFSAEEKKLIQNQDDKRHEISLLLQVRLHRLLSTVKALFESDIEIGNACLPALSPAILRLAI